MNWSTGKDLEVAGYSTDVIKTLTLDVPKYSHADQTASVVCLLHNHSVRLKVFMGSCYQTVPTPLSLQTL